MCRTSTGTSRCSRVCLGRVHALAQPFVPLVNQLRFGLLLARILQGDLEGSRD